MPHEKLSFILYCRFLYPEYCKIISLAVHCGKLGVSTFGWKTCRGQGNHASRRCNATLRVVFVFDVAAWWGKYQTCKQTCPIFTHQAPCQVRGGGMTIFGAWKKLSAANTFTLFFLQLSYFNMLFLIINFSLLEFKRSYKFLCLNSDTMKWI